MTKRRDYWRGFWRGLGAPALIFGATAPLPPIEAPVIPPPSTGRSDLDAMRGDWMRVGQDLRTVMQREETNINAG